MQARQEASATIWLRPHINLHAAGQESAGAKVVLDLT